MATKKKGGGSNISLIITLVFFVLTTVILGITTYMGFSEQEAKDKKVKDSEGKLATMTKDRTWNKIKYEQMRIVMGLPNPKGEAKESARYHKGIVEGNLLDGQGQDDFKEFQTLLVDNLGKRMPWGKDDETPSDTYETLLAARDRDLVAIKTQLATARTQAEEADRKASAARKDADDRAAAFKTQVDAQKMQGEKDRETDRGEIARLQGLLNKENEGKGFITKSDAEKGALLAKLTKDKGTLEGRLADAMRDKVKMQADRDENAKELALLKEKTGKDATEIEARLLDDDALQILRTWDVKRKDWRVTALDRTGQAPYINLGSADNLHSQMTFSLHKMGPDGRLVAIPKGTLEVVRIIGPHLSQCRLTSAARKEDRERDPIIKGDYLFNPQWDPLQKRRVVLAGLADMNEDRSDATRDFRELLKRGNVDLGGYIDAADDKGPPKMVGDGVNKKTDYVIVGDSLDDVNHPRAKDREFKEAFSKLVNEQREKGRNEAVPVITLRRYLQMIGYVPPKVEKAPR